jgi:hypothetical protein
VNPPILAPGPRTVKRIPHVGSGAPAALVPLLRPCPADPMRAYPVGLTVNNPRNDVPECLAPA